MEQPWILVREILMSAPSAALRSTIAARRVQSLVNNIAYNIILHIVLLLYSRWCTSELITRNLHNHYIYIWILSSRRYTKLVFSWTSIRWVWNNWMRKEGEDRKKRVQDCAERLSIYIYFFFITWFIFGKHDLFFTPRFLISTNFWTFERYKNGSRRNVWYISRDKFLRTITASLGDRCLGKDHARHVPQRKFVDLRDWRTGESL